MADAVVMAAFALAIGFVIGCYFLAAGIESCGDEIRRGLEEQE